MSTLRQTITSNSSPSSANGYGVSIRLCCWKRAFWASSGTSRELPSTGVNQRWRTASGTRRMASGAKESCRAVASAACAMSVPSTVLPAWAPTSASRISSVATSSPVEQPALHRRNGRAVPASPRSTCSFSAASCSSSRKRSVLWTEMVLISSASSSAPSRLFRCSTYASGSRPPRTRSAARLRRSRCWRDRLVPVRCATYAQIASTGVGTAAAIRDGPWAAPCPAPASPGRGPIRQRAPRGR